MIRNRIAIAFLASVLAWPAAANAGLITWELEGTIREVSASLNPFLQGSDNEEILRQLQAVGVERGVDWRGRIIFDSEAQGVGDGEDSEPGAFEGATIRIEFRAGSFAAATPLGAAGDAWVGQDDALPYYSVVLSFSAPMASPSSLLQVDSANLLFFSQDETRPLSNAWPPEPPDPSDFLFFNPYAPTLASFLVYGHGFVADDDPLNPNVVEHPFGIDGRITSITAVPEPSLLALALFAAPALALRRKLHGA